MHRHTFWCEDIDAPMHAGVQMYDACLCPIMCLNSHASGAGWRGCAGLVFLQSSRFGQAYVFAFRVLFSLGHARPFGMLHAHLLVYAYTIALGCCSSACIKHHPFFQACALAQACFCCCTIERICMLQQCTLLLPALQAVRWCHRLDPMLPCQMMDSTYECCGPPAPQAEDICMPRAGHG